MFKHGQNGAIVMHLITLYRSKTRFFLLSGRLSRPAQFFKLYLYPKQPVKLMRPPIFNLCGP